MQTLQAFFMGAAQGISEFLPISSSAHIVFTSTIYKILSGASFDTVTSEEIFFDILIHLSSLVAVIIFFFRDFKELFLGFKKAVETKDYNLPQFKLTVYILIATFITCVIGLLIKDIAHSLTETPFVVSILLLITGCVLFFSEKFKKSPKENSLKTSALIGLAQGLAVFPGFSRSGLTIGTGIFCGLSRVQAARFSFMLSVPIIILASLIYPLLEINMAEVKNFNFTAIFVGCLTSFVTGYFCIKYFMKFLEKFSIKYFAYYCWLIGTIMIFVCLKFS